MKEGILSIEGCERDAGELLMRIAAIMKMSMSPNLSEREHIAIGGCKRGKIEALLIRY